MRKKQEKFYFFDQLKSFYAAFDIEMVFKYEELFDCKFKNHYLHFSLPFKQTYSYIDFLNAIYTQKIQGFLVLKGLSIRKSSRAMYQGMFYFLTIIKCVKIKKNHYCTFFV
jgi:hypothetical protein